MADVAYKPRSAREKAEERFYTAQDSKPATDEQKEAVRLIRAATVDYAEKIFDFVPEGVCKSKALTDLNTVTMWAIRGVFDENRAAIR